MMPAQWLPLADAGPSHDRETAQALETQIAGTGHHSWTAAISSLAG